RRKNHRSLHITFPRLAGGSLGRTKSRVGTGVRLPSRCALDYRGAAMPRSFELLPFGRKALIACATVLAVGATSIVGTAVPVKGRLSGYMKLLNPVWDELRDPDARSYTFREPSPTVKAEYRK